MISNWYALYTNPRAEKAVNERLQKKHVETYLPIQIKLRQWKDRKKWVEEPLIKSYIFVKINEREYFDVLNTPGIVRYVTFSGKAAVIPEWQILALKKLLETKHDFEVNTNTFQKGAHIKVISGILKGIEGELVSYKDEKMLLIRIEHISHNLIVKVPIEQVKAIK
jgi:transcription antitermination factor NusG